MDTTTEFSRLVAMIELAGQIDNILAGAGITYQSLDLSRNANKIIDNPKRYIPRTDHRVRAAVVELVKEWQELRVA